MRPFALVVSLTLLLASIPAVAAGQNRPSPSPIALTHVTVIDAAGGPTQTDMTVVIRGDRIVAIGQSEKISVPSGSHIVNAAGKFLIPGLWDMNVLWYDPAEYLPLFIANGVTGVQEVLGYREHYDYRKQAEAGRLLSPRWVIGTRWVLGPMPSAPDDKASIFASSEAEARQAVIEARHYGADFIEIGGAENLPREAFFGLAQEAQKQSIPFEGHVPVSVSVEEASNAGMKSIDSVPSIFDIGILAACSSHEADVLKSWRDTLAKVLASAKPDFDFLAEGADYRARMQLALDTYDPARAEALFTVLKKNHTWMCPTLTPQRHSAYLDDPAIASDPRLKYMSPEEKVWLRDANSYQPKTGTAEDKAIWKRSYQEYFDVMRGMHRAGVQFLAGTTTEEPLFTIPGFSLHDELALLVQAGFTPLEALQTATLNPARFMGKEHDFGTVSVGKFADLILLDANPLEDINNTRKISSVVYRGKLYERTALDAMLARVEALGSRKSIADVLEATLKQKGAAAAVRQYRELRSTQPDSYDFDDKYELSSLCDDLLRAKKFAEAVPICELNVEMFPRSWWASDDLAEAYKGAGKKELAIANYKKSLQLDSTNQNAVLKLRQLNSR